MARFTFALVALFGLSTSASAAEPKLTAEDAKYLDGLIADFLFDPTGAERITGKFPEYDVWGYPSPRPRDGWLVRGKGGQGNRVFFTDGENEPAPATFTGVDFVAACKARYAARPENPTPEEEKELEQRSAGVNGEPDLVLAAWLHKLGHDDLAIQALDAARKEAAKHTRGNKAADPRELLRSELADIAFVALLGAFINRADEAALAHGNRLFRLYKDIVRREDDRYRQAEQVLGELLRHKAEGRFGPDAKRLVLDDLPADPNKRVAALISALDEADAHPLRYELNLYLPHDWRVLSLVLCGEAAVPALLDAYETDTRLTRSIRFWRSDFPATELRSLRETVIEVRPVRDAVLVALECILRTSVFEPTAERAEIDFRDKYTPAQRAAVLRRYWREYGKLPFDERMMKVLTAPKANATACREAAQNLAALGEGRTTGWLGPILFANPVVKKFAHPTAAEAIVAVLDRERKSALKMKGDPEKRKRATDIVEKVYLRALVAIGDGRAARILAARAAGATDTNTRRRFASAAFRLGEPKALDDLARAFEAGTLTIREPLVRISRNGTYNLTDYWNLSDVDDLTDLVRILSVAATPAADKALRALSDPKHPYHKAARASLLRAAGHGEPDWFAHPFWLVLARQMLDDTTETGRVYKIADDRLEYTDADGWSGSRSLPNSLQDPKLLRGEVVERVRDRIATTVSETLAAAPAYHPLRTDSEQALKALAATLDRFNGRLRPLTFAEATKLDMQGWGTYIPDIKPLNRAATPDDVVLGDAMFHLNGKGKPADVALSAWVTLKDKRKSCGLAVQAEIGPDGATVYGVIFGQYMRTVPATEVDKVEPVAKK